MFYLVLYDRLNNRTQILARELTHHGDLQPQIHDTKCSWAKLQFNVFFPTPDPLLQAQCLLICGSTTVHESVL